MENTLFCSAEFKGESYKLTLLFLDCNDGSLTDVTRQVGQYVKSLKEKPGLWVRCDNLYGEKYGYYYDSLISLFDGSIKKTKEGSIFNKYLIEQLNKCKISTIK